MKIELSKEDYNFLKELQKELNSQDTDGNAQPVYWEIMETKEVGVPDGCGDPQIYIGDGNYGPIEDAIDYINNYLAETCYSEQNKIIWEDLDKNNMNDIVWFAHERLCLWEFRIIYVSKENKLAENTGPFLTKRACENYIESNHYNFVNPHTYAMTALRNKEFKRLLDILQTMKFE